MDKFSEEICELCGKHNLYPVSLPKHKKKYCLDCAKKVSHMDYVSVMCWDTNSVKTSLGKGPPNKAFEQFGNACVEKGINLLPELNRLEKKCLIKGFKKILLEMDALWEVKK